MQTVDQRQRLSKWRKKYADFVCMEKHRIPKHWFLRGSLHEQVIIFHGYWINMKLNIQHIHILTIIGHNNKHIISKPVNKGYCLVSWCCRWRQPKPHCLHAHTLSQREICRSTVHTASIPGTETINMVRLSSSSVCIQSFLHWTKLREKIDYILERFSEAFQV